MGRVGRAEGRRGAAGRGFAAGCHLRAGLGTALVTNAQQTTVQNRPERFNGTTLEAGRGPSAMPVEIYGGGAGDDDDGIPDAAKEVAFEFVRIAVGVVRTRWSAGVTRVTMKDASYAYRTISVTAAPQINKNPSTELPGAQTPPLQPRHLVRHHACSLSVIQAVGISQPTPSSTRSTSRYPRRSRTAGGEALHSFLAGLAVGADHNFLRSARRSWAGASATVWS